MKTKALSILLTVIFMLTMIPASAFAGDENPSYESRWGFKTTSLSNIINAEGSPQGCYFYIEDYDTYKKYENKGLAEGYDETFFNEKTLLVNWLISFSGYEGKYSLEGITANSGIEISYSYQMSDAVSPRIAYDINYIEFDKVSAWQLDFSDVSVKVKKTFETGAEEDISLNMVNYDMSPVPFESTLSTSPKVYSSTGQSYYFFADNYDDYKYYESQNSISSGYDYIISGYDKEYFNDNILLVVILTYPSCVCDTHENAGISKNGSGGLEIEYNYTLKSEPASNVMESVIDKITLKKSDVKDIDLKDVTVNINKYSSDNELIESCKNNYCSYLNKNELLPYSSNMVTDITFSFAKPGKNYLFVVDSYDEYLACGLKQNITKDFFNDNVLLVIHMYNSECACKAYVNSEIAKNDDNTLTVSYIRTLAYPLPQTVEYATDIISLKRSDVKDIDLSKTKVIVKSIYIDAETGENIKPDETVSLEMQNIQLYAARINQTTTSVKKPSVSKVKKVSVKKTSNGKKIKVSWKKISKAKGYRVKVSLSKKFKKAKKYNTVIKTIKKNKASAAVKIKKPNKRYYVKVRAYKEYVNSKGVTKKVWGEWSKTAKTK